MKSYACPSCGAEIQFVSKLTVSLTCKYCESLIVRDSEDIRNVGKVSALLDDVTPLQLFTSGTAKIGNFRILGRCRWSWVDGFWNEWFLDLASGRPGWLAEAQGQYVVCEEDPRIKSLPKLASFQIDEDIQIGTFTYNVDDIKTATLVAFEGELPFSPKIGDQKTTIDLSLDEAYACAEFSAEGVFFTKGSVYEFEELKFTNLRKLDQW